MNQIIFLPDLLAAPPSAGGLPEPPPLLPSHSFCFVRRTRCLLGKVINHNYSFRWQPPTHSSALPVFLTRRYPSIPHWPLVLSFFLSCSNSWEINTCCQAIYLFRVVPQKKGPQIAVPLQILPSSVNLPHRLKSRHRHVLDSFEV